MARIRTINLAAEELRKLDPNTALSAAAIRRLVKTGQLPYIQAGNRCYLDFDSLLAYLDNLTVPEQHPPAYYRGIRRVVE